MPVMPKIFAICLLLLGLAATMRGAAANHLGGIADPVQSHSRNLVYGDEAQTRGALTYFFERGKPDAVAALIVALRFRIGINAEITAVLQALTGHQAGTWADWVEWQQDHPEIKYHRSFLGIKRDGLGRIDPRYRLFFRTGWDQPEDMRIRLEEIVWGGPRAMDGIPALNHPKMIAAQAADYMLDGDLVFGIKINGDARAYPLRIMGWHEMFNDVIGGVPVALAYCTLCGSGILYETRLAGRAKHIVFGSSGLLYRSNKLMFDWDSFSLWNQFTGEPVVGPLAKSGLVLKTRPVVIMTWAAWRARHPETRILSLDTGFARNYDSGVVYKDYFASPDLMFPVSVRKTKKFRKKEFIFGIRELGLAKAWPLSAFAGRNLINDRIGARRIVLLGDAKSRTVRAYDRNNIEFQSLKTDGLLSSSGETWQITEANLIGPAGQKLRRVAGVLSYWFAWDNYMGLKSEYYKGE